ncbi:hypothetical protein BRADI_2g31645v3 [Brachypodium distachyon]|uniref:Uncharacterized protein n=1 Tax=Brachypodium distachyon TaxID=15368 RepID=A0A2K2DBA8_BRADI|nr:hypothetical protein BRADI_2g31645v3 [Brachypodium distachyon]
MTWQQVIASSWLYYYPCSHISLLLFPCLVNARIKKTLFDPSIESKNYKTISPYLPTATYNFFQEIKNMICLNVGGAGILNSATPASFHSIQ